MDRSDKLVKLGFCSADIRSIGLARGCQRSGLEGGLLSTRYFLASLGRRASGPGLDTAAAKDFLDRCTPESFDLIVPLEDAAAPAAVATFSVHGPGRRGPDPCCRCAVLYWAGLGWARKIKSKERKPTLYDAN